MASGDHGNSVNETLHMHMTRQQVTLVGIFALFLAPLLLVVMMRSSWWDYQPKGLRNFGQLVQPPVQLPVGRLPQDDHKALAPGTEGKWLLLYVMPGNCDQKCIDDIVSLRQIHRAAGRQGEHVSIVILSENKADSALQSKIESIYQELNFIADPPAETLATLARINADLASEKGLPDNIRTYVVDPMLNVILAYRADANPNDINKDLKRLLKWSTQDKLK